MTIRFITPPLAQQLGGIENAVEGLRGALLAAGTPVADGPAPDDPAAVHHFHGLWNPAHSRVAARLHKQGRPYVVSPHGMLEPWALLHRGWKKLPYLALIERRFLMGASAIFVTSMMERRNLLRIVRHPDVRVLPLGCRDPRGPDYHAARQQLGWDPAGPRLLFLSRIHEKKGLDLLLPALARTPMAQAGWRFAIVGDGEPAYLEKLRNLARSLGPAIPAIDWIGPVWGSKRWSYLQAADLFCLPTHSENFGIAVLEALHAGTPVMTTTGTPWGESDLPASSVSGGLFIATPDEASLAETATRAAGCLRSDWSGTEREALARWATDHFGWSALAPAYQAAYHAALSSSRQAAPVTTASRVVR